MPVGHAHVNRKNLSAVHAAACGSRTSEGRDDPDIIISSASEDINRAPPRPPLSLDADTAGGLELIASHS